jgi:hypothetical protein
MQDGFERRKRQRFSVDGNASVQVLVPRPLRFLKPRRVDFGAVLDISTSGLSMVYIADKMRSPEGDSLTISMTEQGITIPGIAFTTVSDYKISATEDDLCIRRRGIRFENLTPGQFRSLCSFLEQYAVSQASPPTRPS